VEHSWLHARPHWVASAAVRPVGVAGGLGVAGGAASAVINLPQVATHTSLVGLLQAIRQVPCCLPEAGNSSLHLALHAAVS